MPRGVQVGEAYAAHGIHFSLTDAGVQEGLANGDSGGWILNGTSGPGFLGFNNLAPSTYAMTVTFDSVVTSFSLDASRAFGSSAGDSFTVSVFLGGD